MFLFFAVPFVHLYPFLKLRGFVVYIMGCRQSTQNERPDAVLATSPASRAAVNDCATMQSVSKADFSGSSTPQTSVGQDTQDPSQVLPPADAQSVATAETCPSAVSLVADGNGGTPLPDQLRPAISESASPRQEVAPQCTSEAAKQIHPVEAGNSSSAESTHRAHAVTHRPKVDAAGKRVDVPLVDASMFADAHPNGCYLVYDPRDNGTFYAKFSTVIVPEALAFSSASDFVTIPAFKYRSVVKVHSQVGSGRSSYFQAWCHWIKEARSIEGEMVLLPAFEDYMDSDPVGFPPMSIYVLVGTKVLRVEKGLKNRPINLRFVDAVACVPESYSGFDDFLKPGAEIQKTDFLNKAKAPQDKFYIEFK